MWIYVCLSIHVRCSDMHMHASGCICVYPHVYLHNNKQAWTVGFCASHLQRHHESSEQTNTQFTHAKKKHAHTLAHLWPKCALLYLCVYLLCLQPWYGQGKRKRRIKPAQSAAETSAACVSGNMWKFNLHHVRSSDPLKEIGTRHIACQEIYESSSCT
jgi:hypothetical protein